MSSRRWVPIAVFAALVLFLFWPIWVPGPWRRAFVYDALWEYWGDLQIQVATIGQGVLPLWNPFDRAGYPFHADIQAGTLYPLQWIFIGLSALIGSVQELVSAKILLHYFLCGTGMYAFVRRRGLPPAAGYAAGAIVLLGYPFSHAMFSAICWSAAWGPWMLWAGDRWGESPTARRAALLGLVYALSFLAGAPAGFFYAALAAIPFTLWRASTSGAGWGRIVASGSVAAVVFLLLAAAQLDATRQLMALSVRSARDLDFIGTTAFTADDLFGFVVPRMPGEGVYLGMFGVVCVALALLRKPRGDTLILGATAVFAVLLAWGNLAPFLPVAASAVPPFGFFRRAHRFFFTTMLAFAPLVAAGLTALGEKEDRRLGRFLLLAGGAAALVFGAGTAAGLVRKNPFVEPYAFGLVAAIVTCVLAWKIATTTSRRAAWATGAAFFLFFELWLARFPAIQRNWTPLPDTSRDAKLTALADVAAHDVRFMDREHLRFRPGARQLLRDFGGYEDDPLGLIRSDRALRLAVATPRLLGHANVRWLFEEGRKVTPKSPEDREVMRRKDANTWELLAVAPAVFWTGEIEVADGMARAFDLVASAPPGTQAVLEEGVPSSAGLPPRAGRWVDFDWNQLVAEVEAPAAGVVVFVESFYPGWEATVDGAPAEILVTNGAWRGVRVGPGTHRIEMAYRAPRFVFLAAVELLTLIVLGIWLGRRERS